MNIYTKHAVATVFLAFVSMQAFAQKEHHAHDANEIGFGVGATYAIGDKAWGEGVHLHYFRSLKRVSKLSLGCGLEQIWAKENHFAVHAGAKYEPFERFEIGVMPGVVFSKHDDNNRYRPRFSLHFELAYNLFNWGNFHLAPVIDFAWSRGDSHLMAGFHLAYCF